MYRFSVRGVRDGAFIGALTAEEEEEERAGGEGEVLGGMEAVVVAIVANQGMCQSERGRVPLSAPPLPLSPSPAPQLRNAAAANPSSRSPTPPSPPPFSIPSLYPMKEKGIGGRRRMGDGGNRRG